MRANVEEDRRKAQEAGVEEVGPLDGEPVETVEHDGKWLPDPPTDIPSSSRDVPRAREEQAFLQQVASSLENLPTYMFGDDGKKKPKWKRSQREVRQELACLISHSGVKRSLWELNLACRVVEERNPQLKRKLRRLCWDPNFAGLPGGDAPASPRGRADETGPPPQIWLKRKRDRWDLMETDAYVELIAKLAEWRLQLCEHLGIPYEGSALTHEQTAHIQKKAEDYYESMEVAESSFRAFKCSIFREERFFDLFCCFGKVDEEMIHYSGEERRLRTMQKTGDPRARATLSSREMQGSTPNVDHQARKEVTRLLLEAHELSNRMMDEGRQVFHKVLEEKDRTVSKQDVEEKLREAQETRSCWWRGWTQTTVG